MKKKLSILLAGIFLIPSVLSAGITDPNEYLKKNVVVKRLKNGITLVMLNRGYSPTLAFEISFKVGSVDENYNTAGAAHFLEHMLFKGTDKIGTKDFAKEKVLLDRIEAVGETIDALKLTNPSNSKIKDLEKELDALHREQRQYIDPSPYDRIYASNGGIGFNASTSRDETGYYVELPASKLELWAQTESGRLKNPVLREYYIERKNVVEERLMRYDSSGAGVLFEEFLAQAYTAHPYRHPTIGWGSNIPYLSIKEIKNFYRTYYIPSRMTITIVGRQNTDETYRIIDKYFGAMEPRPAPPEISITEPEQRGEKRFTVNFEANPLIIAGWHKPNFPAREDYAFDILSDAIATGKSSRLYKSLVVEKKAFTSVSAWNGMPGVRYSNMFMVYAEPRSGIRLEDAERMLLEELERAVSDFNEDDLKRVRNKIESDMVFALDNNKGIARLLSYYQTLFNDWAYLATYEKIAREITADEVKKTVMRYLKKENRVVGTLVDSRGKGAADEK